MSKTSQVDSNSVLYINKININSEDIVVIGQKILEYIEENNIQQNKLAIAARIAPAKLNLVLHGKRHLKCEEYEILCWCLGVSVDKFLEPKKPEIRKKAG